MSALHDRLPLDTGLIGGFVLFLAVIWVAVMLVRYGPAIIDRVSCYLCADVFSPLEKVLQQRLYPNQFMNLIPNGVHCTPGLQPAYVQEHTERQPTDLNRPKGDFR